MNTTMADGAEQRLDAQIAEALFGQPGMSKMDVANRVRELRGDGPALLVGGRSGGMVGSGDGLPPCPFCGHSDFDQWPCEYIDASGANVVRCARCHAAAPMKVWHALSAQPSPGGQGDALEALAREMDEFRTTWGTIGMREFGYFVDTLKAALAARQPVDPERGHIDPSWSLHDRVEFALRDAGFDLDEAAFVAEAADRARQPVGEPVAWLVHWSDMPLESLEVTRSASRISEVSALTNPPRIVPLYAAPPAQPVGEPVGQIPAGFVLVPEKFGIPADVWEGVEFVIGGPGTGEGEAYLDSTAWIGDLMQDDGSSIYGLHLSCDECPEEGSVTPSVFTARAEVQP